MEQTYYLISDAAKKVQVESHVLRYWEDELDLPIKRNELGHRFYTEEDIERFINIKELKEEGLQLKAIRTILSKEKGEKKLISVVSKTNMKTKEDVNADVQEQETAGTELEEKEKKEDKPARAETAKSETKRKTAKESTGLRTVNQQEVKTEAENKAARMQMLLKQLIMEAVKDSNEELCENLKESVLKEMDYQFRIQEERAEERDSSRMKKEEEHFSRLDELLRERLKDKKKRKHSLF